MSFWNADNLRKMVGGTWLALPVSEPQGLSTDSRTLAPGQAFLALKGERFDGHTMLGVAAAAGSPVAIIDNPPAIGEAAGWAAGRRDACPTAPAGMGVLRVADTGRALLKLAAAYRRTLEGTRVIAVAGSNGKTTTVRLIDAVLGERGGGLRGSASQKSFNNQIGVPLTVLAARPGDQYLVCEIGTNSPGEIATLAEVVRPDIAVITSIGREHLEKLGSLRGVAMEEASVLEFVRAGGAGVVNADAPELVEVVGALAHRPRAMISFGTGKPADVRVVAVEQSFEEMRFTLNDRAEFSIPLLGRHNAVNASAAVAVGRRMGLSNQQIGAGLAAVRGPEMRLERSEIGGVRLINDAYNANPDSMRAALDAFGELNQERGRRVVVLGDMLELGEHAEASHRELGERLAATEGLDLIVLVGSLMRHAAGALGAVKAEDRLLCIDELDEARAAKVAGLLKPGDLVLLKGSRRMRLERLAPALRATGGKDSRRAAGAKAPAA